MDEIEESTREFAARMAELEDKRARAEEMLSKVLGKGRGWNGHIAVIVNAEGRVVDLRLNPQAKELRTEDLAGEILAAINAAYQDAERKVEEAMAELAADPGVRRAAEVVDALRGQPKPPVPVVLYEEEEEEYEMPKTWLRPAY